MLSAKSPKLLGMQKKGLCVCVFIFYSYILYDFGVMIACSAYLPELF